MSIPASVPYVEPWLRGTHADTPAVCRAVLHAFDLALDDITKWTAGLSDLEIHAQPFGLSPVSFHLKHIARSIDRLLTYARGGQLSGAQRGVLAAEGERTGADARALIAEAQQAIETALTVLRATPESSIFEPRKVGRHGLPSTVLGLLVHIAEHTQRHTGQIITTAKIVRALSTSAR
jgi:uncharacterized damage-inducible protein DinB